MAGIRPRYFAPSAVLYRNAMRKGFLGDSRVWKVVGLLIVGRRLARKVMGSDPQTVAIERIGPGEKLILRGVTSRDVPKV